MSENKRVSNTSKLKRMTWTLNPTSMDLYNIERRSSWSNSVMEHGHIAFSLTHRYMPAHIFGKSRKKEYAPVRKGTYLYIIGNLSADKEI